jgi:hypothetical protein
MHSRLSPEAVRLLSFIISDPRGTKQDIYNTTGHEEDVRHWSLNKRIGRQRFFEYLRKTFDLTERQAYALFVEVQHFVHNLTQCTRYSEKWVEEEANEKNPVA